LFEIIGEGQILTIKPWRKMQMYAMMLDLLLKSWTGRKGREAMDLSQ
jgi:hypothetical protein